MPSDERGDWRAAPLGSLAQWEVDEERRRRELSAFRSFRRTVWSIAFLLMIALPATLVALNVYKLAMHTNREEQRKATEFFIDTCMYGLPISVAVAVVVYVIALLIVRYVQK